MSPCAYTVCLDRRCRSHNFTSNSPFSGAKFLAARQRARETHTHKDTTKLTGPGSRERVLSPSFFHRLLTWRRLAEKGSRGWFLYLFVRGLERLYIFVAFSRLAKSIPSSWRDTQKQGHKKGRCLRFRVLQKISDRCFFSVCLIDSGMNQMWSSSNGENSLDSSHGTKDTG